MGVPRPLYLSPPPHPTLTATLTRESKEKVGEHMGLEHWLHVTLGILLTLLGLRFTPLWVVVRSYWSALVTTFCVSTLHVSPHLILIA